MFQHRFTRALPQHGIPFASRFADANCDHFAFGEFGRTFQLWLNKGVIVGLLHLSGAVFFPVAQLKSPVLVGRALRFLWQVYRYWHVSAVGVGPVVCVGCLARSQIGSGLL